MPFKKLYTTIKTRMNEAVSYKKLSDEELQVEKEAIEVDLKENPGSNSLKIALKSIMDEMEDRQKWKDPSHKKVIKTEGRVIDLDGMSSDDVHNALIMWKDDPIAFNDKFNMDPILSKDEMGQAYIDMINKLAAGLFKDRSGEKGPSISELDKIRKEKEDILSDEELASLSSDIDSNEREDDF